MSLKSAEHKHLVFFISTAHLIEKQSKKLAQKLNETRYVYHAHAVLDALNSSTTMFKYCFDVFIAHDPNLMHDMMHTPGGTALILAEMLFFVPLALLASVLDTKKNQGKYGV